LLRHASESAYILIIQLVLTLSAYICRFVMEKICLFTVLQLNVPVKHV
jgi:hypothetical protein